MAYHYTNPTGISVAGAVKWVLVLLAIVCAFKGWQAIANHQTVADNSNRLVTGANAVHLGQTELLLAAVCLVGAWAVWYFWQRNEE